MKIKTTEKSLLRLSTAALFAGLLVLAGCGGGGVSSTPAEQQAQMDREEAAAAIEAANMAAAGLKSSSTDADVTDVEAKIMAAKDEIGDLPADAQAAELAKLSGAESIAGAHRARLTAQANAADAEAARLAAEAAKAAAEANAADAEAARVAAEAAKAAAEAKAADAEAARLAAEAAKAAAEANAADAEAARVAAEAAKAAAEAKADAAEAARVVAEAARVAAETAKTEAEARAAAAATAQANAEADATAARAAADAAKAEADAANTAAARAKAAQAEAEAAKAEAEARAAAAATAQAEAEAAQAAAEAEAARAAAAQAEAEAAKTAAEAAKAAAEAAKTAAEANAADAEAARLAAEAAKTAAEAAKTAAEAAKTAAEAETAKAKAAETAALAAKRAAEAEAARLKAEADQRIADERDKATKTAMADAKKLYGGISAPTATDATPEADIRFAAYNSDEDAILVQNGVATADAEELSEDKKTMVADNHGWKGKRYTAEPTDEGTYEAMVYSNVGEPTQGDKFSMEYEGANFAAGVLGAAVVELVGNSGKVASPSFDQQSGLKRFALPSPNPSGAVAVTISGTFHGVAGTYSCTRTGTNVCAVRVAADGFELGQATSATDNTWIAGSGQWTFTPANAEQRVEDAPDNAYASYGWWIHKSEDGETFTASVFVDEKGSVPAATGITVLRGSATYSGGAAGKYALHSTTGGTNDAGHFTARATLDADFDADRITGTIDQFIGGDGESRDWSVELKKSAIGDGGLIRGATDTAVDAADAGAMTVWTIGGTAGDASGYWSGALRNNGKDDVPQVATGTFHAEHGRDGTMVGAFGATKDD